MRARVIVVALVLSAIAAPCFAQEADARTHFDQGVTLYDEGRLPEALAEFREAQRITPSAAYLYNVGQVEAELGHAVEAVAAYEELLATAHSIDAGMRSQIETALREQRARIGTLRVTVNAPGALVALDDVDVGTAPLDLRVSAGEHVVSARANGYETVRYRVIVAGGATRDTSLTMTLSGAAIGSLRVESRVPGVEVVVDGVTYGLTPLAAAIALSAGTHHVEGRRAAYSLFSQDVNVAPGSESRTALLVEPDAAAPDAELGTLRLSVPRASTSLRIDGALAEYAPGQRVTLPAGLHDLDVRVADREPYTTRIDLVATQTYDLRPAYTWTPEARERMLRESHGQQDLGWGLVIGGAAVALAGAITTIAVWADYQGGQARIVDTFREHCRDYNLGWTPSYAQGCVDSLRGLYTFPTSMPTAVDAGNLEHSFAGRLDTYYAEIAVGAAIAAVGGIVMVSGIVLIATAPTAEQIDRGARATAFRLELVPGPSALTLRGVF